MPVEGSSRQDLCKYAHHPGHHSGELHDMRIRHADDTQPEGFMSCKIPHHFLHVGCHITCDTWLLCRHARQNSPNTPLPHLTREKVHPASPKTPKLGCFQPAGRTFSRTGRSDVATLKPTTPLQPLTQATMKPLAPMLAPKQQPLKPLAPLQPKNTPQTPISHPQRRRRFQARLALRVQRR